MSNYNPIDYAYGTLTNAIITYSGVIFLSNQSYSVTSGTEIVPILTDIVAGTNNKANNTERKKSMVDPDAKDETKIGLTGKALENACRWFFLRSPRRR